MSVYIVKDGKEYRDIKIVSFVPEYDPRMQSLPICEFTAEVVCNAIVQDFKGKKVDLYHTVPIEASTYPARLAQDVQRLAMNYLVTSAEVVARGMIRITAKSEIYILEQRTLPAKMYYGTPVSEFMYDVFESDEADGYTEYGPVTDYSYPSYNGNSIVIMYCPAQTARERLLWFCMARGYYVQQWNDGTSSPLQTPHSIRIVSNSLSTTRSAALIPIWNTYRQPVKRYVSNYNELRFYELISSTLYERTGDDIRKVVIGGGVTPEGIEPEDAQTWYLQFRQVRYTRDDDVEARDIAKLTDDLLVWTPFQVFKTAWFWDYEVELEALCALGLDSAGRQVHPYTPGQSVCFYMDEDTICTGIVKSAEFIFGNLEKMRLVIVTDMQPLTTKPVVVRYNSPFAIGSLITQRRYTAIPGAKFYVPYPEEIIARYGDGFALYSLGSSYNHMGYGWTSLSSNTDEQVYTAYYNTRTIL